MRATSNGTSIRYEHDEVGNLTSVSDANGAVTYTHNAVNLPPRSVTPTGAPRT